MSPCRCETDVGDGYFGKSVEVVDGKTIDGNDRPLRRIARKDVIAVWKGCRRDDQGPALRGRPPVPSLDSAGISTTKRRREPFTASSWRRAPVAISSGRSQTHAPVSP